MWGRTEQIELNAPPEGVRQIATDPLIRLVFLDARLWFDSAR